MAIRPITAPETKKSISLIRSEIQDLEYKIFKTDDELLVKLNDAIDDICIGTQCLEATLRFDMIPGKWEYDTVDLIETTFNIQKVKRVAIMDINGGETKPPSPVSEVLFHKIRRGASSMYARTPKYYCFDRNKFLIWKPEDKIGNSIELEVVREFTENDYADYDKDPPKEIVAKYSKFSRYGAIYKCIAAKPELQEILNPDYYYKEFMKYKTKQSNPAHLENERTDFNELNLE